MPELYLKFYFNHEPRIKLDTWRLVLKGNLSVSLHNLRFCRYFATSDSDLNTSCRPWICRSRGVYSLQINPIPPDKLAISKANYPVDCGELLAATEFIDITPTIPCNFRRPVTVKLPLPSGVEVENDHCSDIAVVAKTENGWSIVDSHYKYTRTTVTCDVKALTR